IVQLILFIVDSGYTKHMAGNLKLLCNFVEKYMGMFVLAMMILHQFLDMEIWFKGISRSTRFITLKVSIAISSQLVAVCSSLRSLKPKGTIESRAKRSSKIISLGYYLIMLASSHTVKMKMEFLLEPISNKLLVELFVGEEDLLTLEVPAVKNSSYRGPNRRSNSCCNGTCASSEEEIFCRWGTGSELSHLNFDYINLLSKKDVVIGLPKLKYVKDQLCSSCELSKAKRSSFKLKDVPSSKRRLNLLHMNLCGPMRVANINGKKYILASDYANSDPVPHLQNISSSEDAHVPLQQELDLLFGPLYDEFFTAGTSSVNKSSSPTNNSNQQDIQPSTNIQPTSEPFTPTYVHAKEKNDNQAEEEHLQDDEFILYTNPKMCMFALTMSTDESKNIKEAMADSAWIEAIQEELHQFDRLQWSLKEEVYVAQPEGFVDPDHPEKVYRLRKALYGLKQAPRAWYDKLSKFLKSKDFTKDADHAGCIDTRKTTYEGIQFLCDKLVSWMSKKQDCTTMSSAEAEYVALSASCAQVMWMRTQLQDYGLNYNKIPLYYDSQSAIAISCILVQHSRTKHIHTPYHFIKEQVENGIIELYFVRTEYQLANMFTKALPEDRFKYLVRRIGMRCLTPAELEVLAKKSA
nr:retrovirus-related Pol polyprotein from transposon TNT 1-94 [Tanacetum cinerariifolium]